MLGVPLGSPTPTPSLFGIFFSGKSYPITDASFIRVDPTHWVLDVCTAVTPSYWELKEVSLFLLQPGSLDASVALGLYVKAGASEWLYRGCVHNAHPSDVMPLDWPLQEGDVAFAPGPGVIQIGVSVEPAVEIIHKEGSKLGAKEDFAKRVATDLFRFLESFQTQRMGNAIVVPENALERWLLKFQDKFRRDPDFLTRRADNI